MDLITHSAFEHASATGPYGELTVTALAEHFRANEQFASLVAQLRALSPKSEAYRDAKKQFPAFTPAGRFAGRGKEALTCHVGRVVLDFDDLTVESVEYARDRCAQRDETAMGFASPGGLGFKAVVGVWPIPATPEEHTTAWRAVAREYESLLGLPVDQSGKDVARFCFVTHDPDVYVNWWHDYVAWEPESPRRLARQRRRASRKASSDGSIYELPAVRAFIKLSSDADADHVTAMGSAIASVIAAGKWSNEAEAALIELGDEVHYDLEAHDWAALVPRFAANTRAFGVSRAGSALW